MQFINLWNKKQYPPKVVLMNDAVITLLSEGRDLGSLRVSEITQKAGIGKGTAYEYFSSKEEMIATALEYNLTKLIADLVERVKDAMDFHDILERLVDWMTDNYKNNAGFMILFKMSRMSSNVSEEMRQAIQQKGPAKEVIMQMLQQVLSIGEEEGMIKKLHPYYGMTAIISQIVGYSIYLSENEIDDRPPEQEAKEFVVESIIKMLN